MQIATLTFDDGIRKSCLKAATIFEKFRLSASFNVIATGHEPWFIPPDRYHQDPKGDFGLWNELQARGHEIMPHGFDHTDKSKIPFSEAKCKIEKCLDLFALHLQGFEKRRAVFHFPYNRLTPMLASWLSTLVRAYRQMGEAINPLPTSTSRVLTASSYGPGPCDEDLMCQLDAFLQAQSGWFVYNLHGLDGEGWGPLRSAHLEQVLDKLLSHKIQVLSVTQAIGTSDTNEVGRW